VMATVLSEPGEPVRQVYLPVDGMVALVTRLDQHPGLEVGMVGCEGMLGAQLALGLLRSPLCAVVQGPGTAWRIGAEAFSSELARSESLRRVVHGYLAACMAQLAVSAACLRFHLIGPRLARWLLMRHDRAQIDHFGVTQADLAQLLGVRRVGITTAAGKLQRQGLIAYHRGQLRVLDRAGLEAVACSCYAAERQIDAERLGR
jgi:CRP-like cAMP-binding protein